MFLKKQIPTKDGHWYSVRIMPYRKLDDKIDGVVITFFNISDLKEVEVKLHETEQMNSLLLRSSTDIIIKLSAGWKILEANASAVRYLGRKQKEMINKNYIQMFIPESLRNKTENELNRILNESHDTRYKMQLITAGGKKNDADWSVVILLDNFKVPSGMILSLKKSEQNE
jgi:two-component system CheB/CheR fusion protein